MIRAAKYLTPLVVFLLALLAFNSRGIACYGTVIFAWIMIPAFELLLQPDPANLSAAEEEMARKNPVYDWILYTIVILQILTLFYFLQQMKTDSLSLSDIIGRVLTMGLLCGTFGINVGHELGHRVKPHEKWLARISLMSSLYIHFYIEHNKGHHKRVATHDDPSTARYGEPVYSFWIRSISNCYLGAWQIANKETRKKGKPVFSLHNEMLQVQLFQLAFIALLWMLFGWPTILYFFLAALIGILLLESVNYIEHYGLQRKQIADGKFERAMPEHSWNSDHLIGRLLLFELSRHSDHHYLASKKYQVLNHHDDAPQMPTGYPGMILLALVPPLWFFVMHRQINRFTKLKTSA
ncbi:alkane 1-monooxygenase [Flavihumibacter stibioxidans]|uniref:alkane 1-monooxygenase n=1 Tax=Flavihumibacter stibioxidans TaxID=1834163 RepID=UPI00164EE082|nr:alkane 1-monooxygenase [Flavihumibacter stibioxidans]